MLAADKRYATTLHTGERVENLRRKWKQIVDAVTSRDENNYRNIEGGTSC